MDKITHEVRLANWKNIIEQCNNLAALLYRGADGLMFTLFLRDDGYCLTIWSYILF
nr:hypothetical protein [Eubacterium sp.]